jgi:glycosyltransferase involved in cell wall biosynthesis
MVFMINSLVSFIIPAYNEEKTVGTVIDDTSQVMELYGLPYEIIVVNDGSTDHTEQIAVATGKAKVFTNRPNRGKGYCLRRGLKEAHGDIIVTLDSDGEHKPKEIPGLITPLFDNNDIVSGSRFMGSRFDATKRLNQVGNFLFNTAIMTLTGKQVTDSQTGFRAMRREVVESLNLQSDGYEIETEITVKSLMNGFKLLEVPITIDRRKYSMSKIKILKDGKKILSTIIQSSFSQISEQREQRVSFMANILGENNDRIAAITSYHSKFSNEKTAVSTKSL